MTQTSSGKIDYKKDFKDLYLPSKNPTLIDVPAMQFIMVDGKGDPLSEEYQRAVPLLYSLTYTIKMKGKHLPGYVEYTVPPLEGLWWAKDGSYNLADRDSWLWTSMIRQFDFVTQDVFAWALENAEKQNPDFDYSKVRLETFSEGLCVQIMHTGPYKDEPATIEKMRGFIHENNLKEMTGNVRKHHELYIKNPLRTAPEKLKTVLRIPVEKN